MTQNNQKKIDPENSDQLLTAVGFDSTYGYKRVEVRHGDITNLSNDYDVLVISAFSGDYEPTPGSLMGSLFKSLNLSVKNLACTPYLDFRKPLSTWISKELDGFPFSRILCVEIIGSELPIQEVFENLFATIALLQSKGIKIQSIAMPLLGSGEQGIPRLKIIGALMPLCKEALSGSPHLKSITFAERKLEKAKEVDIAINEHLGRKELILPKDKIMESLRDDILNLSSQATHNNPKTKLFLEIQDVFRRPDLRSFEAGVLARRLIEFVVDDLIRSSGGSPGTDLFKKIETLHNRNIAQWISSYMHVLRIFGNESAHERNRDRNPSELTKNDFIISLFCLNRVLQFWLDFKKR